MKYVVVIGVLLCASSALAQTPEAIVSRDVAVFAAGIAPNTGTPVAPLTNVLASATTCGLARLAPLSPAVNPLDIRLDDPADGTKQCQIPRASSTAIFAAVPLGTGFTVAIRNHGATTVTAWSATSGPFDHVALSPAVPTGVQVN
jgi:hypothetical protein